MHSNREDPFIYAILKNLRDSGEPIGSSALFYRLRDQGAVVSAPTIGRRLQDLEHQGLVRKVKLNGRVLTFEGEKFLQQLEEEMHVEYSAENFLKLLKQNSLKDVLDVLAARQVVETETAALAAEKASAEQIAKLESLLQHQQQLVAQGQLAIDQDVGFHDAIAEASGNRVLASMVKVLRAQPGLNYLITIIRTNVGHRLVVDHVEILEAIQKRESENARKAMKRHISQIIGDVEQYWKKMSQQQASQESE